MPWYVLYTKPKNEKKVADSLAQLGFEVYCPLVTVVRQWSDRKKKVKTTLFSSYLFVNTTEKERASVFVVPGVVRYLFWLGKPALVRDQEIETLKSWLSKDYKNITAFRYKPGSEIKVSSGPFVGQSAVVNSHKGNKLRLHLEALGFTIVMEI